MKKIILGIFAAMLIFSGAWCVYADVTIKKDNNAPPVGRFEIINIKTGGSGILSSLGEILTLDETNLTGVNWQSLNSIGVAGVNWTAANINASQGVNWESLRIANGNTSTSINWAAFGV